MKSDLAKVGVEGSNPFARSNIFNDLGNFGVRGLMVHVYHF